MAYWDESMLIGVAQIDDQHRKLMEAVENLMYACKEGKDNESIRRSLNDVITLNKDHNRDEENLMERCIYPALSTHRRLHAQFKMRLDALKDEYKRTGLNVATIGKIKALLVEDFIYHISSDDKKIGEFINAQEKK